MKYFKKKILPYLIPFVCGLALFIFVIVTRDLFKQTDKKEIYRILSDATFIPGVIVGGVGLLVFLSNEGAFDIISYGMIMFFGKFKKNINERRYDSYYDYKVAKRGNKKSFANILLVGVFFLLFAVLFVILYNTLK